MMKMRATHWTRLGLTLSVAAAIAACGGADDKEPEGDRGTAQAGAPMDTAAGMAGMAGMKDSPHGGMMDGAGSQEMQQHMQSIAAAAPERMKAMMDEHRPMVANMLARMNREMRDMEMSADATWNATIDSIRQDLVRIPEMGTTELRSFFPGHRDRVVRLMEMHQSMMESMTM